MSRSQFSLEPLEPRIAPASLSIGNASVVEGTGGTKTMVFDVTLTGAITGDVSVDYATKDGTATTADNDYVAKTGALIFTVGGATTQHISVDVNSDSKAEADETFKVSLSVATPGASIDVAEGTGTITNDDPIPKLSISDASVLEGNGTGGQLVFTVSMEGSSDHDVTVDFSALDGTAKAGGLHPDYVDNSASHTLTFAAGDTASKTITIDVIGDDIAEADETMKVQLSNPSNATISKDSGVGTILDDGDTRVLLEANDVQLAEGNSGSTQANFVFEISKALPDDVTFHVKTRDGSATAGSDYEAVDQDFTIKAGDTSVAVPVKVFGDTTFESTEGYFLDVTKQSPNVELGHAAAGTITNDDLIPKVSISDATVLAGNGKMVFTVSIDHSSDQDMTVDFSVLDGTAKTGVDYHDNSASHTLTFAAGDTASKTITLDIADTIAEANETLTVKLSNPSNATIDAAHDTGTGTIIDRVHLDVSDVKTVEGNSGTTDANFVFQISQSLTQDLTFHVKTQHGTATAGSDYQAVDQDFTIKAGDTSVTVPVKVIGDSVFESTENYFLDVTSHPSNLDVVSNAPGHQARGTIYNDDIQIVNSKTIRYVDVDGDLATVRITKGILSLSMLTFGPVSDVGGHELTMIDFTQHPALYNGTSVSVTAVPQPGFFGKTDGNANVGYIQGAQYSSDALQFTHGIDFTNVIVDGDLGGIKAGDNFVTPAIRGTLSVGSFGTVDSTRPDSSIDSSSDVLSSINALKVKGDFEGTLKVVGAQFGNIGKLSIGGTLQGAPSGDSQGLHEGQVIFTGTILDATIGKIVGGADNYSGVIVSVGDSAGAIGNVHVKGAIVGGTGSNSGGIVVQSLGSAVVDGDVQGGTGQQSGLIYSASGLKTVSVGGNIQGDSGDLSGLIATGGNLSQAVVHGSITGGTGNTSGGIQVTGALGSLHVFQDLQGGSTTEGQTADVNQTGFISADRIAQITIGGNISSGTNNGTGKLLDSGTIRANKNIASLVVKGSLTGNDTSRVVISAGGNDASHLAIGSLVVKGDVSSADILGGYAAPSATSDARGQLVNANAVINKVVVNGNAKSVYIIAGASPGNDGLFETTADDTAGPLSAINGVTIKGQIDTTEDSVVVAQHVRPVNASSPLPANFHVIPLGA